MKEITKNRAGILRLLFTNPDKSFYMQEIGRILGKKPGNFQRTINTMEKEGVIISEYKANARYFKVNKEYPLYKEMKSIVFKTVGVAGILTESLQKLGDVKYAFIYGSYAKAKENNLSDIDLIIIGSCPEEALINRLDAIEELLRREVNYKIYTVDMFKKELKGEEPFLENILKDKKIMLIGDENELRKIFPR